MSNLGEAHGKFYLLSASCKSFAKMIRIMFWSLVSALCKRPPYKFL